MKLLLINLFLCVAVLVNAQDTLNIDAKLQKEYLTEEMNPFYIGMPVDSFFSTSKIDNTGDISYSKTINTGNAKKITYQCSKDILYEMFVEYKPTFNLEEFMNKKFGPTNSENQGVPGWKIKLNDGLTLLIWQYEQKYCIADYRQFDY